MRLSNYYQNIRLETISMNTENSKTSEPYKFVLNLSQRLDLINMVLFKTYLFKTRGKI